MSTLLSPQTKTPEVITTRVLEGFEDSSFAKDGWQKLLESGDTDSVNLTWEWQRSWWKSFGKGRLLLVLAEVDNAPVALAPFFTDEGMIYNLFPEDILDFVGDISDPAVLDSLLNAARSSVENFVGFRLYFIPNTSRTSSFLQQAAVRLNLSCYDEESFPSPFLDIEADPDKAWDMTRKKSLRRHENYFKREGELEVFHLTKGEDILPNLQDFFAQHIRRRNATEAPSIFLNTHQQQYYLRLTKEISQTGWLRFTRINWKGKAIAFHYGLCYQSRYLFGIPSFEIELAEHSPGEVLLRQLLLAAISEGAKTFDFGLGDESYKYRFSNNVTHLHTWGLYPVKDGYEK